MISSRVFVSCGQRGISEDPSSERGVATIIRGRLEELGFEALALERDGIKGFVQANPITFESRTDLPATIMDTISKEGWHTG